MGNKKKNKKTKIKKTYPTNVDERAKEAMKLEPPEVNDFKKDNEDNIEKFLRYRPRVKVKFGTIKEGARMKNNS